MECILVKPINKKQSNVIKSLFEELNIPFKNEESLEAKIFRLYEEGHYDDEELT